MDSKRSEFWVTEDPPPPDRPRWYCHDDNFEVFGFEDVDEAVAYGEQRAETVMVRTHDGRFYCTGRKPSDWDAEIELHPWPPSPQERIVIDTKYEAAWEQAKAFEAVYDEHLRRRHEWLMRNHPEFAGAEPVHEIVVYCEAAIEVAEFDRDGAICAGMTEEGTDAFGTFEDVLRALAGEESIADGWLAAAVSSVERERSLQRGRRTSLVGSRDWEVLFHVTDRRNRESIQNFGLDASRMLHSGIAGSREPELLATFLCESEADCAFFAQMKDVPLDIWAVDVEGLWVENGPDGWYVTWEPLGPERLRLAP